MEQPIGFVVRGESSLVCKLCHSLHGFKKQSPCARFEKLAILFKPLG